jgi:Uma2 family endonuclease
MATTSTRADVYYPESDGKPMGETIQHRDAIMDLILAIQDWFVDDPLAYVSGNEFLYFVEGQPKWNVSPDVWAVRGIDKTILRPIYKTWMEGGKGPEVVIEVTSKSTRREDQGKKFRLYQDDLKVREYFLFDPLSEYLKPPLQGHRLVEGKYRPIGPIAGRLPSEVLGLHLEAEGDKVRLFDPATARRLLTRLEKIEAEKKARLRVNARLRRTNAELRGKDAAIQQKDAAIQQKDAAIQQKDAELHESQGEIERLRRELEALRAGPRPRPKPKRK